jgi:histidinol-phosphate aminotransferase
VSVVDNIIPSVRALGAYTLKATESRVKLNQNESPFDLPLEFKQRVLERVSQKNWNRYPDFHPADVLDGLGHHHGLAGNHVLVGNGSNELIQALFAAAVRSGVEVAIPSPTFSLYRMMIEANEGSVRDVPLNEDFSYNKDAWRELAKGNEAHLLLCTPNNPTGSSVDAEFVAELAGLTDRLVIVDEAYQHFGEYDISTLVAQYDNVIVLRTFSKALGLAGIRFGYALAAPELVPEIGKVKLPYNVNIFTLEVARLVLEEPDLLESEAAPLVAQREKLEAACDQLPFDPVIKGMANFVVVRTENSRSLFDFLFDRGILVRDIGKYPMLSNCLRFSVGTEEETDELIDALKTYFSED